MIETLFFLGGVAIGWLLLPQPFDTKYENGFLEGVRATIAADKRHLKDGRIVYFIKEI